MDNKISVETGSPRAKKLKYLLPPPVTQVRRFYKLEGDKSPAVLDCPTAAMISLLELQLIFCCQGADVTLVAKEMKDFEVASRIVIKVTPWLDWWFVAVHGLANSTIYHQRSGSRLLTKTSAMMLLNCSLECRDMALSWFTRGLTEEDRMELRSNPIYKAWSFFSPRLIEGCGEGLQACS